MSDTAVVTGMHVSVSKAFTTHWRATLEKRNTREDKTKIERKYSREK